MKKLSQEKVEKLFLEYGIKLLEPYKGYKIPLKMLCVKKQEQFTYRPDTILRHKKCPLCKEKQKPKLTFEEVKSYMESFGIILKSKEYLGKKYKLNIECAAQGHEDAIAFEKFKRRTHKCQFCVPTLNRKAKHLFIEALDKSMEKKGLKRLAEYKNQSTHFLVQCLKHEEHRYNVSWGSLKLKNGCAMCKGHHKTLEFIKEEIAKEEYICLAESYVNAHTLFSIKCPNKNHGIYLTTWNKWTNSVRCPKCNENKVEKEISALFDSLNIKFDPLNKEVIGPLELDFYLPEHKLAIEHCGLFWHSEKFKDKNYHLTKLERCQKKGIRLLTIYADEWIDKKEIIISRIKNLLGISHVVYARKCLLKEISLEEACRFLNKNHLQGFSKSIKAWGLYYDDELVSALTIGKHHRQGKHPWVLNRFCNKLNTTVVGGASKLLKATKEFRPLISWADLRWSEGNVYEKLGFKLEAVLPPDYCYTDKRVRISKQALKKTKEEKLTGKTEHDLRLEQGYLRLWDCGKQRWLLAK